MLRAPWRQPERPGSIADSAREENSASAAERQRAHLCRRGRAREKPGEQRNNLPSERSLGPPISRALGSNTSRHEVAGLSLSALICCGRPIDRRISPAKAQVLWRRPSTPTKGRGQKKADATEHQWSPPTPYSGHSITSSPGCLCLERRVPGGIHDSTYFARSEFLLSLRKATFTYRERPRTWPHRHKRPPFNVASAESSPHP